MSPRAGLDRSIVVAEAARLLNSEGSEALSLNRLAKVLGVKPPSLYNHVNGMPGLLHELSLLNARRMGERLREAATGRSGAQAVEAMAHAARAYIKENPGLYTATLTASGNLPGGDRDLQQAEEQAVEVGLAVMASFGLHGEDAVHAVRGFRSMVHGFAMLEIAGAFGLTLDCDESFGRMVAMFIRGLQQAGS